jgi:lipopolysaccharide transport system ATP-binding protein
MMGEIAIQVENLSKRYKISAGRYRHSSLKDLLTDGLKSVFRSDGHPAKRKEVIWVLKDVSFEVPQGELLGIIGRNGAGKSTLLKVLSRITEPTTGHFRAYGRVSSLLEVGTGFHPELTGRENIFLNGAILGMGKKEINRKFDDIVAFAETGKFIDTPVKRYSSGMYVRLAFAVAAHLEPDVLLVDEVLAVGDASFQKKCLGKMGDISKEGRTVVFVSHNMVAVNSLCKRAIWLNNGEIIKDGPSAHVVTNYLATGTQSDGPPEEVWDDLAGAPGNDMVRLHRVCIRPRDGHLSEPLAMHTPFLVEVEYWNLVPESHLHITLHLYTDQGLIAFTTASFDPLWSNNPMPVGLFRSVCFVPGDLLNSGQHRFVVLVVKDSSSVIYTHESGVSFDILDVREREGAWYGKEPGVVQPLLKWATEYLGEDSEIRVSGRKHE